MVRTFNQFWWLLVLRGLIAVIFGVLAFMVPATVLLALVLVFGIYALTDGVMAVITGLRNREENSSWWVQLLEGLAGIAAGAAALFIPGVAATALLFIIAYWAIFTGAMEIISAIRLRREIDNEWSLAISGALSVLLGFFILLNPGAGLIGLLWAIGGYAVLFGLLFIYLGLKARRFSQRYA